MERLLWAILALIALVSGESDISIAPTNSTPTTFDAFTIQVGLQRPAAPALALANLLPLSSQAWQTLPNSGQSGNAVIATTVNLTTLASFNIIFIPCDPSAYPGFQGAASVVEAAINQYVQAIVLYSTTANYCNYSATGPTIDFVFTMTNMTAILPLESALNSSTSQPMVALIARQSTFQNTSQSQGGSNSGYSPVPSPSTAVAMIILYSITGVITALFLIIIITGAFRAHRHPERYGPRNIAGRPRQSRARGLARAMLETIPIVKFGERDEPKPNDVELARNGVITPNTQVESGEDSKSTNVATVIPSATQEHATQEEQATADIETLSHISAPTSQDRVADPIADSDENLTCSICTEDFERGQDVRVLPCNHSFHPACIDPWLLNVSGTCPLCRIDLRPLASDNGSIEDAEQSTGFAPPLVHASSPTTDNVHDQNLDALQRASRRVSGLARAMLNPRRMENASREERIAALRRLRERARESGETEQEARRRRRLTTVLSERFSVRTRRGGAEAPDPSERRRSIGSVRSLRSVGSQRSLRSLHQQRSDTVPPVPVMPIFVTVQVGDAGHRMQHGSAEHGGDGGSPLQTILSNSTWERAAERRRGGHNNEDAAAGAQR